MFWSSPAWDSVTYWSLDLETGGLDPERDAILAVGAVPIRDGVIHVGEAFASLTRPGEATVTPEAVAVHGLLPGDVREAPKLASVLDALEERLRGGILLVHNASVDVAFLRKAYRGLGRAWPRPVVVDTVPLLLRLEERRAFLEPDRLPSDPELNLEAARRDLGLPAYPAHNALVDALATAELFLVLRHRLGAKRLKDVRSG